MAKIEPIESAPAAFAPLAAKINEVIAALNRRGLTAGPGIKLTPSDHGTTIEVYGLTGELDCETTPPSVTIWAE
jgi:hypothetical protein